MVRATAGRKARLGTLALLLAGCAGGSGTTIDVAAEGPSTGRGGDRRLRVDLTKIEPGDPRVAEVGAFVRSRAPHSAAHFYEAAVEGPWRARRGSVVLLGELRIYPRRTARVLMWVVENDADPRVREEARASLARILARHRGPHPDLEEVRFWFNLHGAEPAAAEPR